MGRWVRWFGTVAESTAVMEPLRAPMPAGRVMRVSVSEARVVAAGDMLVGRAATPTGQMSVQQLSAEMLTAVLVQEGILTTANEHSALQEHRATGRPVEEILVETEKLTEMELVSVLSRRCKVPHLSLEHAQVGDDLKALVPLEFARANRLVPLQKLGKILNVATTNPLDMGSLKRLEELTGLRVKPMLATVSELRECLDKHYPAPPEEAERPDTRAEMKITVKDFLKESWLGALGHAEDSTVDLPTIAAEQEAQAREEGPSEPVVEARDEERAIRLSDDEVSAFQRASAALLHKDWSHSIGLGGESAGAAIKVGDVEFKIVAADAPLPRDDPQLASSTSDTSAKTSRGTRKKKRRKRRPSGK